MPDMSALIYSFEVAAASRRSFLRGMRQAAAA